MIVYTEYDSPDGLQHKKITPSTLKSHAQLQSLAEALIQFAIRHPRAFALAFGSAPAIAAVWLFISSVQNGAWIWAITAGFWLMSIITCLGGINYLLQTGRAVERSNRRDRIRETK